MARLDHILKVICEGYWILYNDICWNIIDVYQRLTSYSKVDLWSFEAYPAQFVNLWSFYSLVVLLSSLYMKFLHHTFIILQKF
jgi:hypothetical protein